MPDITNIAKRYPEGLINLNHKRIGGRMKLARNYGIMILIHEKALCNIEKTVRDTLMLLGWEIVLHPAYF